MRSIIITSAILFLAMTASAQPAPPMNLFSTSSDVAKLIEQAKSEHTNQPLIAKPILQLAPYRASMEYRASVGAASVHEKEAEFFYVIDGSATMMTGGKLVNEKRNDGENLGGTAIEGGNSRSVAKGDFIVVPENTPHWFSQINGTLILMSLHVPRTGMAH